MYVNLNNEQGRILSQIKKKYIYNFPIKVGYTKLYNDISNLANKMLEINKKLVNENNPDTAMILRRQVEAIDNSIDKIVYGLYGLSDNEIRIVEG